MGAALYGAFYRSHLVKEGILKGGRVCSARKSAQAFPDGEGLSSHRGQGRSAKDALSQGLG